MRTSSVQSCAEVVDVEREYPYQSTAVAPAFSFDVPGAGEAEPARLVLDFSLLAIRRSPALLRVAEAASNALASRVEPDLDSWAQALANDVADADD